MSVPKFLVILQNTLPLNFGALLAEIDQAVDPAIHLAKLIAVLDRRFDLAAVQAIDLSASGKRPENVLCLRQRINRHLLRLAEVHESVVRAVQCLVPSLVPRELILNIRVYRYSVFLEDLHATSIVKLVLERRVLGRIFILC